MPDYSLHYEAIDTLQQESRVLPPPRLFNYDGDQILAAEMERLAQPLPNGRPSPFSSKSPASTHYKLLSAATHLIEILGHEIDLIPDRAWLNMLRLMGVELESASYPVVRLEFTRSTAAIAANIPAVIPIGTAVRSSNDRNDNLIAYTLETIEIAATAATGTVNARLNTLGDAADLAIGQFTILGNRVPYIEAVTDTELLSSGKSEETIVDAVVKVRQGVRAGSLGRFSDNGIVDVDGDSFLGRCVTLRDYVYFAKRLGAEGAIAWRGTQLGAKGYFGDLITVAVYPPSAASLIDRDLRALSVNTRLDIVPARVIPIDGTIHLKAIPTLTESEVIDLAATAIVNAVNPPYGVWGDRQFVSTLSTAIEKVQGIYAVPKVQLKHAISNIPLSAIAIEPDMLFQIQSTIVFVVEY